MKPTSLLLVIVLVFSALAGIVWFTWQQAGSAKEAEILKLPHKRDSVVVEKRIPVPYAVEKIVVKTVADTTLSDSLFRVAWNGGKESVLKSFRYLTASIETTAIFARQDTATVHVKFNPITRMLTIGLQLSDRKEIERTITDSVRIPEAVHDSFITRATIPGLTLLAGIIIGLLVH